MKALILAAGFGKRLEPYTRHTPKPLFTISNQPLLDRVVRKLSSAGISHIMVNTHHLHQQVEQYLLSQKYPIPIGTQYEPEILGTAGAIKKLTDFWGDESFMVVNSDILFDTDLEALCRYHMNGRALATLVLYDHPMFNQVWVDPRNHILGFDSGTHFSGAQKKPLTFTGIQIIHPELLDFIPANRFYSTIDAYKTALLKRKKIRAYIPDRMVWTDIGSPERYRDAACQTMAQEAFFRLTRQNDTPEIHMQKLAGDGSDRLWYRLTAKNTSIIMVDHGIRTGLETEEVDSFIRIGKHLSRIGVAVPGIILSDPFAGLVFLEDLGDLHLQEMVLQNKTDTAVILSLYHSVIDLLIHMALAGRHGFDPKWTWQSATYDQPTILDKECRYFVTAFLNRYLDMAVSYETLKSEFVFLAESAAACTVIGFMHRDLQSRNIMIDQNRCCIIDFQGGRTGPLQYDLASLLMDPYVALSQKTILTLYNYYVKRLSAHEVFDEAVFRKGFETCTLTRNLQILGAFGHLSRNKGKSNFEAYIPRALQTLLKNLARYHARERLPGLRKIVQKAAVKLAVSAKL
jgi:aminoglycoside/choline kinase family phosphotransferase/GTP:adenosylcobinamide-phosphate guanylyltransferase